MRNMEWLGDRRMKWVYGAALAGLFAFLAAPLWTRPTGDWEQVYLPAAERLRTGGDVLAGNGSYVYPPFGALFAVPFTFLPRTPGLIAWALVDALALAVLL